ncbi:hypothetical protein [Geodermatophilus marinus]|uniref:hypothetical protein n=1 Tax=Geodermatophilus sp. LHW52908 TaxID=2303986 RepID=UPI0011C17422|nr:hypothetical protein [Geodermatophilus sp. LHW52908]
MARRPPPGTPWELHSGPSRVTAVTPAGTVAEARVTEQDEQVVVEFWADEPGLPAELGEQLVTRAFALPAVRPHHPVLVCVPRHSGTVLDQARRRVQDPRTRVAGVTCLVEGRVGGPAPVPSPR